MFEPEDFLETIERMIDLNEGMIECTKKEDLLEILAIDLSRLRDLHHRIRLQFNLTPTILH